MYKKITNKSTSHILEKNRIFFQNFSINCSFIIYFWMSMLIKAELDEFICSYAYRNFNYYLPKINLSAYFFTFHLKSLCIKSSNFSNLFFLLFWYLRSRDKKFPVVILLFKIKLCIQFHFILNNEIWHLLHYLFADDDFLLVACQLNVCFCLWWTVKPELMLL